jgi:hypothetical protein
MSTEERKGDRVDFEVISDEAWNAIPAKPAKAPSEWEPVLDELEKGKAVRIAVQEESKQRGMRLALGRRAIGRGFKVEMRYAEGAIAARRSDMPYTPPEPKPRAPRRRKD